MASRHKQDDRARRLAAALSSFCRAQVDLPVHAVAQDDECLRLAAEIIRLQTPGSPPSATSAKAGRRPRHDRRFARAALLDFVTRHPDGMPHQAAMCRELERRFEATGLEVPGETWLKKAVREFQEDAAAFEVEAADTFRASPALQAVFADLDEFMRFRRAKTSAMAAWQRSAELRAQFSSPEKLLEAAFHNGSKPARRARNNANLRLSRSAKIRSVM